MTGFYGYARTRWTWRRRDATDHLSSLRFLSYSNYEDTRRRIEAALPEIHTTLNDPRPMHLTFAECPTSDCFHWDGTKSTTADPPSPVDLRDAAIRVMDRFWRQAVQTRW